MTQKDFEALCRRLNPSPWQQAVLYEELYNPWHTGTTPTEEGFYVLTFPNELGFAEYCVGYWNGEKFLIRDVWEDEEVKPIAWQKIEPYKETDQ